MSCSPPRCGDTAPATYSKFATHTHTHARARALRTHTHTYTDKHHTLDVALHDCLHPHCCVATCNMQLATCSLKRTCSLQHARRGSAATVPTVLGWPQMHLVNTVKTYFLRVHTAELTAQIDDHRLEIRKLTCCVLLGLLEGGPSHLPQLPAALDCAQFLPGAAHSLGVLAPCSLPLLQRPLFFRSSDVGPICELCAPIDLGVCRL